MRIAIDAMGGDHAPRLLSKARLQQQPNGRIHNCSGRRYGAD